MVPLVDCTRYRCNDGDGSFCSIGEETFVYEASERNRSYRDHIGVDRKLRDQLHLSLLRQTRKSYSFLQSWVDRVPITGCVSSNKAMLANRMTVPPVLEIAMHYIALGTLLP